MEKHHCWVLVCSISTPSVHLCKLSRDQPLLILLGVYRKVINTSLIRKRCWKVSKCLKYHHVRNYPERGKLTMHQQPMECQQLNSMWTSRTRTPKRVSQRTQWPRIDKQRSSDKVGRVEDLHIEQASTMSFLSLNGVWRVKRYPPWN